MEAENIITSRQNPLISRIASLSERKYRERERLFRFDGTKLFSEAVFAGVRLRVVLLAEGKPVYDAYRKAKNKERYRAGHERDIILHEAAARALKTAGITKLPNPATLQKEYEALQAQKEALYADYGKLKKKVREYDVIKQNIDSILQIGKQPERGKETERG